MIVLNNIDLAHHLAPPSTGGPSVCSYTAECGGSLAYTYESERNTHTNKHTHIPTHANYIQYSHNYNNIIYNALGYNTIFHKHSSRFGV